MSESLSKAIDRAAAGVPLPEEAACAAAEAGEEERPALFAAASAIRDSRWGRTVTYSPKVFLPLTNLCRNHCDYCSFRRSPGEPGEWTMAPAEVATWLDRARAQGCAEALLCLGDKPEASFPSYRQTLNASGYDSTVAWLEDTARRALDRGLLPHTNAGLLTAEEMGRLKRVNVSLGLMLESASERLCQPGLPHHRSPDKRPARRLRMIREAGELRIPFTSGVLIGIGETRRERAQSLLALRELHREHGHLQEVIVQNFRAQPGAPMEHAPEPPDREIAHCVALARLILDPEVGVQAPPNLNPAATSLLLGAGINDFGGLSPVSPDYVNRGHPWPNVEALAATCAAEGFTLRPRLAVYPQYIRDGWMARELLPAIDAARARLGDQRA